MSGHKNGPPYFGSWSGWMKVVEAGALLADVSTHSCPVRSRINSPFGCSRICHWCVNLLVHIRVQSCKTITYNGRTRASLLNFEKETSRSQGSSINFTFIRFVLMKPMDHIYKSFLRFRNLLSPFGRLQNSNPLVSRESRSILSVFTN